MTMLEGKRLLLTGVLTEASLAFGVARTALRHGPERGVQRPGGDGNATRSLDHRKSLSLSAVG